MSGLLIIPVIQQNVLVHTYVSCTKNRIYTLEILKLEIMNFWVRTVKVIELLTVKGV